MTIQLTLPFLLTLLILQSTCQTNPMSRIDTLPNGDTIMSFDYLQANVQYQYSFSVESTSVMSIGFSGPGVHVEIVGDAEIEDCLEQCYLMRGRYNVTVDGPAQGHVFGTIAVREMIDLERGLRNPLDGEFLLGQYERRFFLMNVRSESMIPFDFVLFKVDSLCNSDIFVNAIGSGFPTVTNHINWDQYKNQRQKDEQGSEVYITAILNYDQIFATDYIISMVNNERNDCQVDITPHIASISNIDFDVTTEFSFGGATFFSSHYDIWYSPQELTRIILLSLVYEEESIMFDIQYGTDYIPTPDLFDHIEFGRRFYVDGTTEIYKFIEVNNPSDFEYFNLGIYGNYNPNLDANLLLTHAFLRQIVLDTDAISVSLIPTDIYFFQFAPTDGLIEVIIKCNNTCEDVVVELSNDGFVVNRNMMEWDSVERKSDDHFVFSKDDLTQSQHSLRIKTIHMTKSSDISLEVLDYKPEDLANDNMTWVVVSLIVLGLIAIVSGVVVVLYLAKKNSVSYVKADLNENLID